MENSRPRPGESDNDDAQESVGSKRRSREFLSYYQRLLGRRPSLEEALNPSETEEDEEDDEEKPKKWRGFFKRIFGNVVTPPGGERQSENQHGFNPDAWYAWQTASSNETPTISAETDEQLTAESEISELPEASAENTEVTPVAEAVAESPAAVEVADTIVDDETLADVVESRALTEMLPNEPVTEVEAIIPHEVRASETTQPVVERETIVERGIGGGLPLLLVGAEYLGRKHADKKIKKEFSHKLASAEQRATQQETHQSQLETLIQQNRQQLETLKRERGIAETLNKEEVKLPRPETKPNLPPPEERVPTDRILESVVDAAEHNVPVERIFERSHEVKDEPNVVGAVGVNAQSVGAVMAAQMAQRQAASTLQPQANTNQGLPVVVDEHVARDMYAQAIKSGFIGAIMIIILGLLAYLVIQ